MVVNLPHNFDPTQRPYQLEILRNKARFKVLVIHRRAGKTSLAVNKLIIEALQNPDKTYWYVAPTYRMAKDIVWRDPEMLFKYIPKEIIRKKNEVEMSVTFINGSVLILKGADQPDTLRGSNPMGVVIDEYALIKPEVWDEIIQPIMRGNDKGWCWFIGTPKPQGKHFHELWDKVPALGESWFRTHLKASESGIIEATQLEEAKAQMTQAGFEQEFECVWFDEQGVVFRGVDECVLQEEYKERGYDGRFSYQFGIDLAMHVDWTVIIGVNKQRHTVEVFDRFNQIDYNLQKARIEAIIRRYGGGMANVDQTGVGEPIVQDLMARGLSINGIQITETMKRNLVTNLALWIEQRKIKFPRIPELIEELKMFGYEVLKSGRIRYSAPEGRHDDCVMALALAVWELGSRLQQREPVQKFEVPRTKVKFSYI